MSETGIAFKTGLKQNYPTLVIVLRIHKFNMIRRYFK